MLSAWLPGPRGTTMLIGRLGYAWGKPSPQTARHRIAVADPRNREVMAPSRENDQSGCWPVVATASSRFTARDRRVPYRRSRTQCGTTGLNDPSSVPEYGAWRRGARPVGRGLRAPAGARAP